MNKYRIAMGVEYAGQNFSGWQRQLNASSVQENIEKALSCVSNETINVICAGRTDAGVHAKEQVIHFETHSYRDGYAWVFGANTNLPKGISVLWSQEVSDKFHARFSAQKRTYHYVIYNRHVRPALMSDFVSHEYRPLDISLMEKGAHYFIGTHDFTSFRTSNCQAHSPIRTVHDIKITKHNDLITLEITANAFLHHMVRNLMGVLCDIGAGVQPPEWTKQVLNARDRRKASVTAPPNGLYLMHIAYPQEFELPQIANSELPHSSLVLWYCRLELGD